MLSAPTIEPHPLYDSGLLNEVLRSAEPTVVETYHESWERPWRALDAQDWRELWREFGERINGVVVETGRSREFAVRHGVEVIPAVLVFLGGEVVARFSGKVRVADVIAAVVAALDQARVLESAAQELDSGSPGRETLSPGRWWSRGPASESTERGARADFPLLAGRC